MHVLYVCDFLCDKKNRGPALFNTDIIIKRFVNNVNIRHRK